MSLLARARGLQERIRPCYLASIYTQDNVRTVEGRASSARAKEVLLVCHGGSYRPAILLTHCLPPTRGRGFCHTPPPHNPCESRG